VPIGRSPLPLSEKGGRAAQRLRGLRLRLGVLSYILRKLGPTLAAVAAYMVAAAALVRWDIARAGGTPPELHEALFSIFMLLSFEPTEGFPPSAVARVVFWLTPLMGIFLIAEGLLKVGASLLDPATRREVWTSIMTDQLRGHVVVCGLGHVGYRVVEELRRLGEDMVAIEQEEDSAFIELVRAKGVPVHVGNAQSDDLLVKVGIARAKAVVCATSDDLANLEIALDAKRMNPKIRVVMRMFDQRLAAKVGGALELDESFSTSSLAAPLIAMQATQHGVRSAYRLDDQVRVTAEVVVGAEAGERSAWELEEKGSFRIVSRRRGDGPFVAVRPKDAIRPGDVLIIDTSAVDLPSARYQLGG
jgi:Trk K+ transport system NAD-binding subunit